MERELVGKSRVRFGLCGYVHLERGKYLATFWWPVGTEPTCSKGEISLFTNILLKFMETESKTVVSRARG